MATLKEVLADKANFADNVVIEVGGVKTTLGELRAVDAAKVAAISAKEQQIADQQAKLERSLAELTAAQTSVAQTFAEVQRQREELAKAAQGGNGSGNSQPDPFAALEKDSVLGPAFSHIKQQNTQLLAKLAEEAKNREQLQQGLNKMVEVYLSDRLTETYRATVPADKQGQGELKLENLIRLAKEKGYNTPGGYVDIARAYSDLTANDTLAAKVKAAEEAGYKKALEEAAARGIVVQAPSGMASGAPSFGLGGNSVSGNDNKPFKNLDEAFAAAAKDAELWREWNGLPAGQRN